MTCLTNFSSVSIILSVLCISRCLKTSFLYNKCHLLRIKQLHEHSPTPSFPVASRRTSSLLPYLNIKAT